MFISLKRIIKAGWKNFSRNIALNLATVLIMVMVISLATLLFLLKTTADILIADLQERVDVSVYFKEDILADDILKVKSTISEIPEVKEVEYVSKEDAFERFVEQNKENPVLMESLIEVGFNPFLASLNIKAWQISQYGQVANLLEAGPYKDLIDKVDYHQRKPVIEKVSALSFGINRSGIFFGLFLGIIAVLVAFNAIRIAIFNSGEEIKIQRLVGASNKFIRGPFLTQGIIIGIIAALITFLITFAICSGLNAQIKAIAPQINLFSLFLSNFWALILVQFGSGILLGAISSAIAVRKYLKV